MPSHEMTYLDDVLVFLLAVVVVVPLFRALRSSPVLGYLAAGVIIGPHGLALIGEVESVETLAEFGIVFLLFTIGLELSVQRLKVLRRYVFGLGTLQVLLTGTAVALILVALDLPGPAAVIIGGGLALSSTAFVLQMLVERGELATRYGRVGFSILLLQDLAIVPLLALVPLLQADEATLAGALGSAALKASVAVVVTFLAGRYLLRPLYRQIAAARSPELFVATTLLVLLGSGFLMHLAGVSMALGAFLAGLLLSGTEYRHQVEGDISPFRGLLLGLFFASIGMSIDLALIAAQLPWVLAGLVALMLGKAILISGLCLIFGLPLALALRVGLLLSQGGEFAFVLVTKGMLFGVVDPLDGQIVLAIVALSMVATPLVSHLGGRLSAELIARRPGGAEAGSLTDEVGEMKDHVVIAGFGRVGRTVAQVLAAGNVPYLALDRDPKLVADARKDDFTVHFGDASRVEVLRSAGLAAAKAAVITLDQPAAANRVVAALREQSPGLNIFVRARDLRHAGELHQAGADAVVPETIEASLQLGGVTLQALGARPDEITGIMDDFRQNDYERLRATILKDSEDSD